MAQKRSSVFRNGRVQAYDSKYTGEEPDWIGVEKWSDETFKKERSRMLGFYNYYLGSKELNPSIIEWMKRDGFSESDIKVIKDSPDWIISQTVGKFCRAILRGMPSTWPSLSIDDGAYVRAEIKKAIPDAVRELGFKAQDEATEVKKAVETVISPRDRLVSKVKNLITTEIDSMVDAWCRAKDTKVEPIDIRKIIQIAEIPGAGCPPIVEILQKLKKEFTDCIDRIDDQAIASYAHLSKKSINSRIAALDEMISEVQKLYLSAKAKRKVRMKKEKSADKQVAHIKFMQSSKEYGIESIAPVKAVGCSRIITFNDKTRVISVYDTNKPTGLSFKGSSLDSFDSEKSFSMRLRKPNDILPKIMSKPKDAIKHLDMINGKKLKVNGRFNDRTLIVGIFT